MSRCAFAVVAAAFTTAAAVPAQAENFIPTLKVAYEIKGAVTAKGTSDAVAAAFSCADWAAGRLKINDTPTIEFMTSFGDVGGNPFYLETVTKDYKGPGSYDGHVLPLMVWIGGKGWRRWGSDAADFTKTKLTIAADGSGSIAFEGYTSDRTGDAPYPEISGTMSWTCVSPAQPINLPPGLDTP
jgi:hypothetical protein